MQEDQDLVRKVIRREAKIDTLENCIDYKTSVLQEKITAIEKKKEETYTNKDDEIRIKILKKKKLYS